MKNLFTTIGLLLLTYIINAQNTEGTNNVILTEGAALLFVNTKTKLTTTEKNNLFQNLQLQLSADKKSFLSAEIPVDVSVYPTDMNKDGNEEIFVVLASVQLFGNAGQTFSLYIKNKKGVYMLQEVTGPGSAVILTAKSLGYHDLLIGGPGFTFPVYKWNGSKYIYHRKMKNGTLNNNNSTDIEPFSKRYTNAKN